MREIKFRGLNRFGCWVYGYYVKGYPQSHIIDQANNGKCHNTQEVDDKTVGQYTGLKDKNGKEIYEGDILEYKRSSRLLTDTVRFSNAAFWCGFHDGSSTKKRIKLIQPNRVEIIGNIHDNN